MSIVFVAKASNSPNDLNFAINLCLMDKFSVKNKCTASTLNIWTGVP